MHLIWTAMLHMYLGTVETLRILKLINSKGGARQISGQHKNKKTQILINYSLMIVIQRKNLVNCKKLINSTASNRGVTRIKVHFVLTVLSSR